MYIVITVHFILFLFDFYIWNMMSRNIDMYRYKVKVLMQVPVSVLIQVPVQSQSTNTGTDRYLNFRWIMNYGDFGIIFSIVYNCLIIIMF